MTELANKLSLIRSILEEHALGAVRLRGTDWFSWVTCGGSNVVLQTAETGIAEVLVSRAGAWVLTDEIEAERLAEEEVPEGLEVWAHRWMDRSAREAFVGDRCGGPIASDRPSTGEQPLPPRLFEGRWSLTTQELERYRALGRDAAAAVTDVLTVAGPEWTGLELAGAAAEALWAAGIQPALVLVGDGRRLPRHRHPTPSTERLGERAMLVLCARRHGLFANLTRFVSFRPVTPEERRRIDACATVEAAALDASRPGATLGEVFGAMVRAYASAGHAGAERHHHQGGSCGYLSRDVVATPGASTPLVERNAVAWNPSLPGAKSEDTVVVSSAGEEVLTVDPRWPVLPIAGRRRPDVLER